MSNRPGIYHDIGKDAEDLLYKDYTQQPPFRYKYGCFDCNFDVSCGMDEILPGLRTKFRFIIPYQNKVDLQYLHDYFGITSGISLKENILLNLSGAIGNGFFSMGTDLCFDVNRRKFDRCDAGLSINSSFLVASLTLNDMANTLRASLHTTVCPLTNTAVAAELTHKFLTNENVFTFGTQHALFPITLLKARVSSNGRIGALIQQQLLPSFFFTVAGDVDFRASTGSSETTRIAKVGLSLAVRP
ncbi:mitochondrial outer membrane protein porin of 36 kDa-like [Diospyros lotus]|uniref:mitochondrial outer membrane protein porin of 36 kDa-like n=1 Tax=Diospyros lotus TaxID=55363 RepID=UPI002258C395|nr:mitochondrial outer membrane protein porin of 36 kDa-like [Diospyros lotus]